MKSDVLSITLKSLIIYLLLSVLFLHYNVKKGVEQEAGMGHFSPLTYEKLSTPLFTYTIMKPDVLSITLKSLTYFFLHYFCKFQYRMFLWVSKINWQTIITVHQLYQS